MRSALSGFVFLGLLALAGAQPARAADTLISTGAVWKYLDDGSNQGTNWTALNFNDSGWSNGVAQLGFGDADEVTIIRSNRTDNTHIATYYFRRIFELADPSLITNLTVRLLRDDGGVVYLNGIEVFRSNMPTGAITSATLAPTSVPAADETTNFYPQLINPALLLTGSNVVAVEIHQNSLTSSDLSFDLGLIANILNVPPVVAITNIANNSFFKNGTNVLVAASASDVDDAVTKVEFFAGATKIGEDTSSPYSITWSNVALGAYTLTVVGTDAGAFSSTSAPVNIFLVTNVPPIVSISSPTNNAGFKTGTNITINATATDLDNNVVKVEFYSNGEKLGEDATAPFSLTWSNVLDGQYALLAVATDDGGVTATSSVVNILVATNLPPAVSLTSPTNNAVLGGPGDITLRATAGDPDGTIARVEFYNGNISLGLDTSSPYSLVWSNVALGSYTLTVVATDNLGLSRTSAPANILVRTNVAPTVNITSPTNSTIVKVGTNLTVAASAVDSDGAITLIEFFRDGQKFGERTNSPASAVASNLQAGSYVFHAVATDNASATATSAPVNVLCVTNFRPTVTISSPTNNTTLGGPIDVTVNATASDRDGTITLVEFFAGDNKLGEDVSSPYSITWSNAAFGTYVLTAIAHDNVGLTSTSAPIALTIKTNTPPNVSMAGPAEGTVFRVPTSITLLASAADADGGIRRVEFFAELAGSGNIARLGEKTNAPFQISWTNATDGAYALTAVATDLAGASSTSAPVNILLVTNLAPTVSISAPTNNTTLGGPIDVLVSASASDSDGGVVKVEFFAGTSNSPSAKIGESPGPVFQYLWAAVPVGNYILTAIATDTSGVSRTSAPVNLSIRTNVPPSVAITSPRNNSLYNLLSNVVVTATASDTDGVVRRVEFFASPPLGMPLRLGEVTNSPFTLTWSNILKGVQVLTAIATDSAGAMRTSAPVQISVLSNLPPTIAITNPVNNTILSLKTPVTVQVRASDPDGTIVKVELFQSEFKIAELTAPPFNFPLSNLYAGAYTFRARATDSYGDSVFSDAVTVTFHNRRLLIPQGSVWRYLDTGVDQSNSWRSLTFDDSSWTNGRAQLGFGDGDEVTVINGGPSASRFPTIYFRHSFVVTNRSSLSNVVVRLLRDDGGVVYLNGNEVFRSNISTNATNEILFSTLAPAGALAEDETYMFYQTTVSATNLIEGTNVCAVEIHQNSLTSSDLSFDLELSGADAIGISRGPYLQSGSPTSVIVRWRTDGPKDSLVRFGTDANALDLVAGDSTPTNEHIVELVGLMPDTRYYYSVGSSTETFVAGIDCTFKTAPAPGQSHPTRIWVLGDSGIGDANQRAVRDAYYTFAKDRPPDLWLMLGDNAYQNGTEEEFQSELFDMYPPTLRESVLWPIISNHDVANLTNNAPLTLPYFQIFSLPTNAVGGGVPSGTERYYSFDYGDIHFVCLDSQTSDTGTNSAQYHWLEADLTANHKNWLIATCGNPPYGRIGNDTDTMPRDVDVRTHLVPLLEAHGLDLYFAGDDHAYERSFLLDGHYGLSATLTNTMILNGGSGRADDTGPYDKHVRGPVPHRGAVYVVAGSSGHLDSAGPGHPANYITRVVLGSVILDVDAFNLQVQFLTSTGTIDDYFTIVKSNLPPVAQSATLVTAEDTSAPVALPASDPDGDPLTWHILAVPTNGIVLVQVLDQGSSAADVLTNGSAFSVLPSLVYVPKTNFNGVDALTFSVNDGFGESEPALITLQVLAVNDAPVARALAFPVSAISPDNVSARVVLDGSRSFDVDNDPLQFFWSEQGSPLASGRVAAVNLTIGPHTLALRVSDGDADAYDQVQVQVATAGQAVDQISLEVANSSTIPRNKRPLQAALGAASDGFDRLSREAGINELGAFQSKVRAQIAPTDSDLADHLTRMAQYVIDAVSAALDKPHFHSITQVLGGDSAHGMRIRFTAASPGQYYIVEASIDLIDWVPIGVTEAQPDTSFEYTDVDAAHLSHRFYRVTQ